MKRKLKNRFDQNKAILCMLVLVFCCTGSAFSQLILCPASRQIDQSNLTKVATYNLLPFIDDFSDYEGLPNQSKWLSGGVVINPNYQFNPPTVGVATLDATDYYGKLYSQTTGSPFAADTLTSQPIRLDSVFSPLTLALSAKDSVYLSFFFQPAGGGANPWETIGTQPSMADSLILEFYSPADGWNWIWASGGLSSDSLYAKYGTYYQYVLIPITDEKYFTKDFQFRFRNIASLNNSPQNYISNCDEWNVDYVYLNKNRHCGDTVFKDIAFVEPAPSMLKRYQSMPSQHFVQEEMADTLSMKIVNLYNEALSSTYKFQVKNEEGLLLYSYDGGFENISPYSEANQYQTAPTHARPTHAFSFDLVANRRYAFDIVHTIKQGVGQDNLSANDTVKFRQVFDNYFAYDDGTAENGVGVEPISGSHLAIAYTLNAIDTLSAVDIYFNRSLNDANFKPFYICIWNSENNLPKEIIYKTERLTPESDSLNQFVRYVLEQAVLLPKGKFFVSLQTKGNDYLNIGFDRNTNSAEYTFTKTTSDWQQSFLKGSVMLRPCFGSAAAVGLDTPKQKQVRVYPNPTNGKLITDDASGSVKRLFDTNGRLVLETRDNQMDLSGFDCGIYILQIINRNGETQHTKIIKTK